MAPSTPRKVAPLLLALCGALAGSALFPAEAAAKKVFVQKRDAEVSSGGSVSVALKKATKPGNLIVAYVVWDNGSSVSLADTGGNPYVSAVGPTAGGDSLSAQVFYARNIAGGANSVTASFATPITTHAALYVHEYSGLGRLAPFDAAVAASGTSEIVDSGPLATHSSSAFLFVGAASNGPSIKRLAPKFKTRAHRRGELTAEAFAGPAGSYQVTALQSGTDWILQLVAFTYSGRAPASPRYPVEVSANGRYLVDQAGAPFLIMGDSPQCLMTNLSEREAASFFANRRKRGFNAVWINLLCATYTGGRPDASTYDGIFPFTNAAILLEFDLTTPNEAYFSRVDDMLRLAAKNGIFVLLDPAETGSFLEVLAGNDLAGKARPYGQYLGTRYRGFDNIVWMSGNDFNDYTDPGYDAAVQAVARGIQDTDATHIHTVELNLVSSLEDPTWAPLIQLNATYTYRPTYAAVLADYNRPDGLPTFLVEANYEFEHLFDDEGTPEVIRRQAYWSLLSGAAGQFYGNHYTWALHPGWKSHFNTPGSTQMRFVKRLFESRRWWELVPDQSHSVVVGGNGTFTAVGAVADSDYLTAARTPDGSLVMAYLPSIRTITVDMSQLVGPANASWYDPTRGSFTRIAGSPFPNISTRDFTPPGPNRAGDGDWVLVLEAPH